METSQELFDQQRRSRLIGVFFEEEQDIGFAFQDCAKIFLNLRVSYWIALVRWKKRKS